MILCRIPGCGRPAQSNQYGQCLKHYAESKRMVAEDKTTWEELIERGLAAPKDSGAKAGSVEAELLKRRAENGD